MSETPTPRPAAGRWGVWPLAAILLLAAGVRLAVVQQAAAHDPTFGTWLPAQDMYAYDAWARAMVRGDWAFDPRPEAPYSPVYPVLVAAIYGVAGAGMLPVALVQVALGILTVCAVYFLTRRLFDDTVAAAAALGYAMYVPDWFYATQLLRATWVSMLIVVGTCLLVEALRARRVGWYLGAGLAFGLASAIRPNNALLLLAAALAAGFGARPARAATARAAGMVLAGGLIAWGPWLIWNAVRPRPDAPMISPGLFGLVAGNTPDATGVFFHIPPMAQRILASAEGPVGPLLRDLGEAIAAEPVRWLGAEARKAVLFWHGYEPMNNVSLAVSARYVPLLRLPVVQFWPTAVLALAGLMTTCRRSPSTRAVALCVLAVYASTAPFFVLSRYRIPIVPLLMPFAAWTLVHGWPALRRQTLRGQALVLAAVLVGATVLHPRTFPRWFTPGFVAYFEHQADLNLVVTRAQQGRLEDALAEARALYMRAPEFPPALPQFILLLRSTNRHAEAEAVCAEARAAGTFSQQALAVCGVEAAPPP